MIRKTTADILNVLCKVESMDERSLCAAIKVPRFDAISRIEYIHEKELIEPLHKNRTLYWRITEKGIDALYKYQTRN